MFVMKLVASFQNVKAERDNANRPSIQMRRQCCLLSWLSSTPACSFERCWTFSVLISQKFWPVEKIDLIEDEHRHLLKVYNSNLILKVTIDKQDHQTSFNLRWDVLPASRFDSMRAFVSGLATVFANTTPVESDFSILKWEMDKNQTSLMHLSLEGIFQAKQQSMLQALIA